MQDLLSALSWQTDKCFRRHHNKLPVVLWVTEDVDGRRQWHEAVCGQAPETISDSELLQQLAADMRSDFVADGVVRVAVAYFGHRIRETKFIPTGEVTAKKTPVVFIELHSADTHLRAFREVIEMLGHPTLTAMTDPQPITDGAYMDVLPTAGESQQQRRTA